MKYYEHNSMVEISGASRKCLFIQFSQEIDGFRQKDQQGFRTHTTLINKTH